LGLGVAVQVLMRPVYESRAKFTINQLPFEMEDRAIDAETQRQMVQTLILGISSERMQQSVAEKLGIDPRDLSFREFEPSVSLQSTRARANIRVTAVRNSRMGVIRVQSQDPEFAARVANAIMEESKVLNVIGAQLLEYRRTRQIHRDQLNHLNQKFSEEQVQATQARELLGELERYLQEGKPLEYFPAFEQDATLNNLKTQLMLVESEYRRVASQSTRGARLEGKAAEVAALKQQMSDHAQNLAVSLRTKSESLLSNTRKMEQELRQMESQLDGEDRKGAQILDMFSHPERAKNLAVAMALPSASSNVLVVMDSASANRRPIRPILALNLVAGAVLGTALGLILPLLIQAGAIHLTRGEQVRKILGQKFLGYLPPEISQTCTLKTGEIFSHMPYSIESEYFRDSLLKITDEHPPPYLLAFIPCGPRDIASYLVAEVALQLVEAEKKVLIVDLNLEMPRQAEVLGLDSKCGLHNWLIGERPLSEFVTFSAARELALLHPCGRPEELRAVMPRRSLSTALVEEGKRWDFVLIDSHPLTVSSELLLALPAVRQVILVAEYGKTRIDNAKRTVERALRNGWNIRGVVLRNCPKHITEKARAS
jgi:capsular polysaccharide biosynthesis protein